MNYCLADHCICSPSIGSGVEAAVADVVAGVEIAVADIAGVEIAVADIADFEIVANDTVAGAGAGVEVAVADIADDVVVIAVPTLFNLADAPSCNNYNTLG